MDRQDGDEEPAQTDAHVSRPPPMIDAFGSTPSYGIAEAGSQQPDTALESIIFKDHRESRYVWPFERCKTFESTRSLIEEVYALPDHTRWLQRIQDGEYSILNHEGAVILPSVWSAIVRPRTTISIRFTNDDEDRFFVPPPVRIRRAPRRESEESERPIRIIRRVPRSESEHSERRPRVIGIPAETPIQDEVVDVDINDATGTDDDDGTEEDSKESNPADGESNAPSDDWQRAPPWDEVQPMDSEGIPLSFKVDTSKPNTPSPSPPHTNAIRGDLDAPNERKVLVESFDVLKITKAVSMDADGRSKIQLHTLPGPNNSRLHNSVKLTWYHLSTTKLDFTRFREACEIIPNMSERMKVLMKAMLTKLEKHKVKPYLDGLFIEPGAVVRVVESCQSDPQSIIFSCIPYYDLQPLARKPPAGPQDRIFHTRTLMQTFYPYEPVRDRDTEQAYRKYGNDQKKRLVHVPNFWILNIGRDVVLSFGPKPLAEEMIKSIEVTREDLSLLSPSRRVTDSPITTIRLTDWDGRVNLFSLESCRSYFQLEQKVQDIQSSSQDESYNKSLQVTRSLAGKDVLVIPRDWRTILQDTGQVFIELSTLNEKEAKKLSETLEADVDVLSLASPAPKVPFLEWKQSIDAVSNAVNSADDTTPMQPAEACMAFIEKLMMEETLADYSTVNEVDKTFSSTQYYQLLPEASHSQLTAKFESGATDRGRGKWTSHHQFVVKEQCQSISMQSLEFCKLIQATVGFFVSDLDMSTLLRKLWGALNQLHETVEKIRSRDADSASGKGWWIRTSGQDDSIPLPGGNERLTKTVKRCKRCGHKFATKKAALEHLQRHIQRASAKEQTTESKNSEKLDTELPNLDEWVIEDQSLRREESNAGALAILKLGCGISKKLLMQASDIIEGVKNEDGSMSDLYSLPVQLLMAFRKLIIFYLAIERAIYYTEEAFEKGPKKDMGYEPVTLPFSPEGLERLKWFGNGPARLLAASRSELCAMARPIPQPSALSTLSLGPEYICAWLMRRLIVKPLANKMSIGDMYREFLSTIQFQVNHRPGKRLIRSINLLQEELQVLLSISKSQSKLLENYTKVLDPTTLPQRTPAREAQFPYDRLLLRSALETLSLASEDYEELFSRCGPLSDKTKQSLEINEEDHGKAIMVFTIVTLVFLPLSFVTSYLGMNTSDIRDMESTQSLFWTIAVPLTVVTVATILFIGYNGDELRDLAGSLYRLVAGKQPRSTSSRGLSVAQRKRATQILDADTSSIAPSEYTSVAYEAEYASPQPEFITLDSGRRVFRSRLDTVDFVPETRRLAAPVSVYAAPAARDDTYGGGFRRRVRRSESPRVGVVPETVTYEPELRVGRRTRYDDVPVMRIVRGARPGREGIGAGVGADGREYEWQKKRPMRSGRDARFRGGYRSMGGGA